MQKIYYNEENVYCHVFYGNPSAYSLHDNDIFKCLAWLDPACAKKEIQLQRKINEKTNL